MAVDWITYRSGLRRAVGAVWPEVLPSQAGGGVFTRARIEEVAFEELAVPLAVIQPLAPQESQLYSAGTNQAYEIQTLFHYVLRRDLVTDMEEAVEAKLGLLADYLLYQGLPKGQVIAVTALDALEEDTVNMILLEKNLPYYGGTLTARLVAGQERPRP